MEDGCNSLVTPRWVLLRCSMGPVPPPPDRHGGDPLQTAFTTTPATLTAQQPFTVAFSGLGLAGSDTFAALDAQYGAGDCSDLGNASRVGLVVASGPGRCCLPHAGIQTRTPPSVWRHIQCVTVWACDSGTGA